MPRLSLAPVLVLAAADILSAGRPSPRPTVELHYLGHASFVLSFDNGVSVLMDYGVSNAYGLASPIHDVGKFTPTVVAFSHHDPDHDRSAAFPQSRTLQDGESLSLDGVTMMPIRTSERKPDDNFAYLITYKGLRILHAGDAQGDMAAMGREDVRNRLRRDFAGPIDLLLVPVGWTRAITPEAEAFVRLLSPRRVVPMHYWSAGEKAAFLSLLRKRNAGGADYRIREERSATFALTGSAPPAKGIEVVSLEPAPLE